MKALPAHSAGRRPSQAFLYAFDLLELDGGDLRPLPWEERRQRLMPLIERTAPGILLSEHADGNGEALFQKACEMGLEGLVANAPIPVSIRTEQRLDQGEESGRPRLYSRAGCHRGENRARCQMNAFDTDLPFQVEEWDAAGNRALRTLA